MTKEQVIQYLRVNTQIGVPQEDPTLMDSYSLYMSDEELALYLLFVMSRDFSEFTFEELPPSAFYPLMLLIKREIYRTYATKNAHQIDMGADNNNYLKRSQRFAHFMKLIGQINEELADFEENGGLFGNTLVSADVYLSNRQYTNRTRNLVTRPTVNLRIDSLETDTAEISWRTSITAHFMWYKVYFSTEPILDLYVDGAGLTREGVTLLTTNVDFHRNSIRLSGLEPETTYYMVVEVTVASSVSGYKELEFTTPSDEPEPEETEPPEEPDTGDEEEEGEEGEP